jgi:hypothetical protein
VNLKKLGLVVSERSVARYLRRMQRRGDPAKSWLTFLRNHREVRAPWQNGVAEKWIGSARRDCFDHVIALNEVHVRRLGREFIAYYHEDRTHLRLNKDTPSERSIEGKREGAELESVARVGGLYHRYV